MDAERARYLNEIGTTLLCLNVPQGTSISLDRQQTVSGPLFKGYKMIPEGIHLFTYSAMDQTNDVSPPSSQSRFFYVKKKGDVIVLKWSNEIEDFVDEKSTNLLLQEQKEQQQIKKKKQQKVVEIKDGDDDDDDNNNNIENILTSDEVEAFKMAVKNMEFDKNLAPYPIDDPSYLQWKSLTKHITLELLDRIQPISGTINGDANDYDSVATNRSTYSVNKEKEILDRLDKDINEFKQKRNITTNNNSINNDNNSNSSNSISNITEKWGVPYYSVIPRGPPVGSTPAAISQWNIDKSDSVQSILDKYYKNNEYDLIGEIEFCYVLFIYGLTYSGFVQWKNLVTLMLQCDRLVDQKPRLFGTLLQVLALQMDLGPSDLFVSDISSNIFLKPLLKSFIESNFQQQSEFDDLTNTTSTTSTTSSNTNNQQLQLDRKFLFEQVLAIKRLVEVKFHWTLSLFELPSGMDEDMNLYDEENEDLPVIVYTTEFE